MCYTETTLTEDDEREVKPAASGKYVPPSMRRAMASGGRRTPKGPPQIESEEQFPSLSASVESAKTKPKGFVLNICFMHF